MALNVPAQVPKKYTLGFLYIPISLHTSENVYCPGTLYKLCNNVFNFHTIQTGLVALNKISVHMVVHIDISLCLVPLVKAFSFGTCIHASCCLTRYGLAYFKVSKAF